MPTRSAHSTWTGGLQDGTGVVTLVSSGIGTYRVNFPKRAADNADGTTSPEELIAAAHSACFAMQFPRCWARRAAVIRPSTSPRTSPSARTGRAASGSPASR